MFKKIIAPALILLSLGKNYAQEFKSYTQNIDGTKLSFDMQAIPAGTFKMGSKTGKADEKPVHDVKLDAFWMGKYEVTWNIFEPFLYRDYEKQASITPVPAEVDAVTRPTKPYLDMTFGMGKENQPAIAMTQYNAIQFCKWLYCVQAFFTACQPKQNGNMPAEQEPQQISLSETTPKNWEIMPGSKPTVKIKHILSDKNNPMPGAYMICMET